MVELNLASISSLGVHCAFLGLQFLLRWRKQKQETQMPSSPGVERNLLIVLEGSKEEEEFVMDE